MKKPVIFTFEMKNFQLLFGIVFESELREGGIAMNRNKRSRMPLPAMLLAAMLFMPFYVTGQDLPETVKYTPDFRFRDGIYLSFDQVKANRPVPKAKLLTSSDYNDKDFFTKLFASEKIYYYDEMGVRQEIEKDDIWGFARNGVVYVMIQGNFNRITFFGNICHFVADVTTYDNRYNYYSPYGYYDPYYSPYSYYGGYYPYDMYSPYSYRPYSTARNELRQYIIDFETGKIVEFTVENVKLFIMKDPEIYEEYVRLSRKKQKELMFVYVRKFNDKNPLYLSQ